MTIVPRDAALQYDASVGSAAAVGDMPTPPSSILPMDVAGAAFRQNNIIASGLSDLNVQGPAKNVIDPSFDPFAENKKRLGKEDIDTDRLFVDVFNKPAYDARWAEIEKEREDRRILDSAGVAGDLMSLGASIVDLPTLIPGGAVVRGARLGETALKGAVSIGAASAAGAAVSEAGLQATQSTRPVEQSAFAIGGSAVLGALLGAGVGAWMGRTERIAAAASIDRSVNRVPGLEQQANEDAVASMLGPAQSVGAAAAPRDTLEDLSVAGTAAKKVSEASSWARLNPIVRLMESPSTRVRETAIGLMENPLYLKKNLEGRATEPAIETLVKEYSQGAVSRAVENTDALYLQARKSGTTLTRDEFRDAVGMAMRRADKSDIPEVQRAAETWRSEVFDPLKKQAIEAGLLPEDVSIDTAESYFSRVWNWRKIEANESEFKAIVRNWIGQEVDRAVQGGADNFVSAADKDSYVGEIADEVYNRITGRENGDIPRDIVPTERGPLKERTFHIPDRLVEKFIESDVEAVGRRYARIMAAEVEMTRKFGSPDMKDQIAAIRTDYADERAKIEATNPKDKERQLMKLADRERRDVEDVRAVRDILRGTFGAKQNGTLGARALAVANTFNFLRSMGGMAVSSVTDIARPMFVHGLGAFMSDGIKPLVTNLHAVKLSVREAKLAGTVAEKILHTRLATWSEITDPYAVASPFERLLDNTAKRFSTLSGMVHWNDFMKSFASTMTQNRILRDVADFGATGDKERAYLAFLGIDDGMAARIARQFEAHGQVIDGVHVAGTDDWTDEIARRTYRAALNKDVDSIIVSKGVGDVPLFSRTPIGRTVLQFKSFALASHQRAFMRGLQGAELGVDGGAMGALAGMMTTTTIGMFLYWLKAVEANHTDTISDNPGQWIAEGLDRGGMLAVPFEINNTVEKAFGIGAYKALQTAFPGHSTSGKASRYQSRGISASILGPSGQLIDTIVAASTALNDGKISDSDVNAFFNLVPFLSLPGARSVVAYGIKPKVKEAVVTKK